MSWLGSKPFVRSKSRVIAEHEMDWTRFDDSQRVSVVGQDYHQAGLKAATGGLPHGTDRYEGAATLVLEPDNPHDVNAVKVMLNGQKIGYLRRASAKRLHKRIAGLATAGASESYPVLIRRQTESTLQAHLQIPYSSKLLEGLKNRKRKRSH